MVTPSCFVPVVPLTVPLTVPATRQRNTPRCATDVAPTQRGGDRRVFLRNAAALAVNGILVALNSEQSNCAAATSATGNGGKSSDKMQMGELRGLDSNASEESSPPFRSVGGVQIQEVIQGTGDAVVRTGATVSLKYVLRRSNGYFVDASYGFDRFDTFTFIAGRGDVIDGFERGVAGMREGGRRRFVVPPSLGYGEKPNPKGPGPIPPGFGPRRALAAHSREPLVFEVLVVRIR